jgi:serine/threonine protein kinase
MARHTMRQIGDYDLLEKIADGGMSTVYKGRRQATGQIVAIKVVTAKVAENAVLRQRFRQEFQAARDLEHEHLVRGLEFGEQDGTPFMVMEFVDGPDLSRLVEKHGRLCEADAVRIITQVGRALGQAHARGLIHRDVKPENILLDSDGQAKLTDLGLVKNLEMDLGLTRLRAGMGTLNFMAPEQFDDAKHATARCDVYSLAATLYFAVTGELPFTGRSDLQILKKKLLRDVPAPRRLAPGLSEAVEQAILQGLEPQPEQRPQTCARFLEELSAPIPVEGPTIPARIRGERRATVRYPSRLRGSSRAIGGEKGRWWAARVPDISAAGIHLLMERRFEPGSVLLVELHHEAGQPQRTVLVRVVRVKEQPGRKWSLGCVFDYCMSEADVKALG